jgi:hypothetical protein
MFGKGISWTGYLSCASHRIWKISDISYITFGISGQGNVSKRDEN